MLAGGRAYHRLALLLHPDKNPHEGEMAFFFWITEWGMLVLVFPACPPSSLIPPNSIIVSSVSQFILACTHDTYEHPDAKVAFVRVSDAYDQLRHPISQRQALAALRKPSHKAPAGAARASKPRSFKDVMREWEEFEREWFEHEESHGALERHHRAEKKVRCVVVECGEGETTKRPLSVSSSHHVLIDALSVPPSTAEPDGGPLAV